MLLFPTLISLATLLSTCQAVPVVPSGESGPIGLVTSGLPRSWSSGELPIMDVPDELMSGMFRELKKVYASKSERRREGYYAMIVDRTSDLPYNGRERLPFEHRLNTLAKEVDEMPPAQRYMCSTVFLAAIHDTVAETLPDLAVLYPPMVQSEMWKGLADDARQVTEYIKKLTGGGKWLERVEKKQYQPMIVGQFQREAQAVVESTTKALKGARLQLSMALEDAEARLNAAKQNLDSATIHTMQSNLENIKATTLRGMCSKLDHLGDPEYTILKLGSQTLTREKVYAMDADMLLERLLENAKALNPSKPEAFIPTMITLKDIWGVAMAVEVPRGLRVSDEMFSGNNTEDEGEGEEDEGSSSGYTYNGQGTA